MYWLRLGDVVPVWFCISSILQSKASLAPRQNEEKLFRLETPLACAVESVEDCATYFANLCYNASHCLQIQPHMQVVFQVWRAFRGAYLFDPITFFLTPTFFSDPETILYISTLSEMKDIGVEMKGIGVEKIFCGQSDGVKKGWFFTTDRSKWKVWEWKNPLVSTKVVFTTGGVKKNGFHNKRGHKGWFSPQTGSKRKVSKATGSKWKV